MQPFGGRHSYINPFIPPPPTSSLPKPSPPKTYRRTEHIPDHEKWLFDWMGANLKDSQSMYISDVDKVIRTSKNCLMLIEVKRMNKQLIQGSCQANTLNLLDAVLRDRNNTKVVVQGLQYPISLRYFGLHTLVFERTTFNDGRVYFDDNEVTEQELIKLLTFNDCLTCY